MTAFTHLNISSDSEEIPLKGVVDMSLHLNQLQNDVIRLYHSLKTVDTPNGHIEIDRLPMYQDTIVEYARAILYNDFTPSDAGLEALIRLNLDQYAYSEKGEVFISDHEYDMLMNMWMSRGGEQIIYCDVFENAWPMAEHTAPWMVGSVKKTYKIQNMRQYFEETYTKAGTKIINWVVAPKYDGVSANIEIRNGKVHQALTRGDRALGQDITPLIQRSKNIDKVIEKLGGHITGYLKAEVCVSSEDFPVMKEAGYANRRSATTAVINTPKNLRFARCVSIVPLMFYSENREARYCPPCSIYLKNPSQNELLRNMVDLLRKAKDSSFPYRVDGVVVFPCITDQNTADVMENAMAYKINTAEALTTIEYGYISIGRMGKATPMVKVKPCEVNETIVTDVNIGSFAIWDKLGLHEHEKVYIYSAGDVIPQLRLPGERVYDEDAPKIRLKMVCPYCGHPLENSSCINPHCRRVMAGRITNFLAKLGVEDISDATIDLLVQSRRLRDIADIFVLTRSDLDGIPGIGDGKANMILQNIRQLSKTPVRVSEFFGSLGIPGISTKLCREIFQNVSLNEFLNDKDYDLELKIMNTDALGPKRVETIIDFRNDFKSEIQEIMSHMTIVEDRQYYGNVVFTGFRDKEWALKFDHLGFSVSDNLNSSTVCVIAANQNTGKAMKAKQRGLPIFTVGEIERAYAFCENQIRR